MTELLLHERAGYQEFLHRLVPLVEGELRRIAYRFMRMAARPHCAETPLVN